MQVSKSWLQELVDLKVSIKEVERLLPLRTIATKEITDNFIELDMKGYNRADLLSMRGVAKEVAAVTNSTIAFSVTDPKDYAWVGRNLPPVRVEVEDKNLCPVYCIVKIEGLQSGPPKPEWVKKLTDSGMRSVNNIADITNLIMLEFGQPMHSFDAEKVTDETLIVRTARNGETLETLDGKKRTLDASDLLITDPEKVLGIAGVMGGKDSEASETTTTIFLEAAIFDPVSIRKSSQKHNLYSEASKRFQHGLTKTNLQQALSAAIKMYEELGGKVTAISMTGDLEDQSKTVQLTQEKVNSLIGIDIPAGDVEKYLHSLGFQTSHSSSGNSSWDVIVPYWRLDINLEEDLIEEVARMYGYENIPPQELKGELPEKIDQSLPNLIYDLKKKLADTGLTEVQTYSFYSSKILCALLNRGGTSTKALEVPPLGSIVKVANPISSETEYLREYIWPNLVEVVEKNIKQGYRDIAIFEIGKVYSPGPKEGYRLAVTLMNGTDNPIEELITIAKDAIAPLQHDMIIEHGGLMKELEHMFHPTRFATIKVGEKIIGGIAEVHPRFLNQLGVGRRVAILELTLGTPS